MITSNIINNLDIPKNENLRIYLGQHWKNSALMEHASVASFSRISLELIGLGAPPYLLKGAYNAGLDEIRHAKIAFSIASHYLGKNIAPGELKGILGSKVPKTTIVKLAMDSFIFGYIAEGISALLLRESSFLSTQKDLKNIYNNIAEDEERHSQFGWDIMIWCIKKENKLGKNDIKKGLNKIYNGYNLFKKEVNNKINKHKSHLLYLQEYGIYSQKLEVQIKEKILKKSFLDIKKLLEI